MLLFWLKHFEIKWLSDLCEEELIFVFKSATSSENKLDLLLMGQDCGMMKLLDLAIKFCADMKFQALKRHTRFNEINTDVQFKIFEMRAKLPV